uniref:HMG box domain-containing protein n=1 Tax=Aedes aegypti TaxID=7159 RepID=A0A903VTR4_AEDAE
MERDAICPPCPSSPRERSSGANGAGGHPRGKLTTNPFFNFLRDYRGKHPNLSVVDAAVEGASVWNRMGPEERAPYVKQACGHPQRVTPCGVQSPRSGSRKLSRASSRGRRVSRSASRRGRKRNRSSSSGGRSRSRSKARRARRC